MPTYFSESRCVELSLLDHLDTNLAIDWPGTTVVKTFKQAYSSTINLPIVAVRLADTSTTRLEVGSTTFDNRYLLIIDIFAKSDGMRLDMADYIKTKLKDSWVNYTYSRASGSTTELGRIANGRDTVTDFVTDARIDFGDQVDTKDRFRQSISIRIRHKDA